MTLATIPERPTDAEVAAMRRAVELSQGALPSPDPPVGAVVVQGDQLVGEGCPTRSGATPAVVEALHRAGPAARGATVVVTLAPGAPADQLPRCAEALRTAGVRRVLYAVRARVRVEPSAFGAELLWQQGFAQPWQQLAEELLAPWRTYDALRRAHVTLKVGMSLDGRIATREGHSRWITSEASRRDAHALRASSDAVLAGSGTVLADDPALTVRHVPSPRNPVRVVLDSALRVPPSAQVFATEAAPTWVLTAEGCDLDRRRALEARGVRVLALPRQAAGRLSLREALEALAREGIVKVLCEGGGALHGALRDADLADRVVCYLAPMLLGGAQAISAFGGLGAATLADATRLQHTRVTALGPDWKLEGEVLRPESATED